MVKYGAGSEDRMNFNTSAKENEQRFSYTCYWNIITAAKITSHSGFSSDEIEQFETYMSEHRFEIIEQAKSVNLMKNFMK